MGDGDCAALLLGLLFSRVHSGSHPATVLRGDLPSPSESDGAVVVDLDPRPGSAGRWPEAEDEAHAAAARPGVEPRLPGVRDIGGETRVGRGFAAERVQAPLGELLGVPWHRLPLPGVLR